MHEIKSEIWALIVSICNLKYKIMRQIWEQIIWIFEITIFSPLINNESIVIILKFISLFRESILIKVDLNNLLNIKITLNLTKYKQMIQSQTQTY